MLRRAWQLLAMRWNTEPEPTGAGLLRPKIELVQQDGPLFFEELWVPGFAGNNYHYCQDQVTSFLNPPASAVMQLLAENALSLALTSQALTPSDQVEGLTPELTRMIPTASRLAEIQRLKSACVATYITTYVITYFATCITTWQRARTSVSRMSGFTLTFQ